MGWIIAIICFIALGIGGNFALAQVPSADRARRTAENSAGLENARVVSRSPAWESLGGCKEDDVAKFKVQGQRSGKTVTVEICAPLIGGYTVRG